MIQIQNTKGVWIEAIPLPFWVGRKLNKPYCCARKFKTLRDYQAHYALEHILEYP